MGERAGEDSHDDQPDECEDQKNGKSAVEILGSRQLFDRRVYLSDCKAGRCVRVRYRPAIKRSQ